MSRRQHISLLMVACLLVGATASHAASKIVLKRMFDYGERITATMPDTMTTNVYLRGNIDLQRTNFMLATVPTMYYLMRGGQREYMWEEYGTTTYSNRRKLRNHCNLLLSNVYHRKSVMKSTAEYLMPRIYSPSLFKSGILSPVNKHNQRHYRYREARFMNGTTRITFNSRVRNTQLVRKGTLIVDTKTGRVKSFDFEIEYDMSHFTLRGTMQEESELAALPLSCDMEGTFRYMGNRVGISTIIRYNMPTTLPDSLSRSEDPELMALVRPVPLTDKEQALLDEMTRQNDTAEATSAADSLAQDSTTQSTRKSLSFDKFWKSVGDNALNRTNTDLGDKGQISIAPLFNPLYFGYSNSKGLVYKLSVRGSYEFSDNADISMRIKAGYSFKQSQFYFRMPVTWTYNKHYNGYVTVEVGNCNRISNSEIIENVKQPNRADTIDWDRMNLTLFRDFKLRLSTGYGVLRHFLDLEGGVEMHNRRAVDKAAFAAAGRRTEYFTFAPYLLTRYYPLGRSKPWIITASYEQGIKAFNAKAKYKKIEVDNQLKIPFSRMRTLSFRLGAGGYINRGTNDNFLYYENFQKDNIPGGWNDDWTGEFELLNSAWYNASGYYLRLNTTYESPLLILSWCPLVGQIVEQERIYLSSAKLHNMGTYFETGYGFTNRLFSMGVFAGFSRYHFEGFGLKFGFELFDRW